MMGLVTGWLKVKVMTPRLAQRKIAEEQPAGLTSISTESVVAEIAGDSCAEVTPPIPLSAIESSKMTAFAPESVTCIVVVPG